MKVVALVCGGKDSCFATMNFLFVLLALFLTTESVVFLVLIVALENLLPVDDSVDELSSYMYHTVGHHQAIAVSSVECMNVPLFRRRNRGSSRALLCLLTLTFCVAVGASATTTTIHSPDGDIIDCVDKLVQPSFKHPLLKYHKLQEIPTNLPNVAEKEDEVSWQVWHGNGSKCPEGTIPIRRHEDVTTNYGAGAEVTIGHEYAIASLNSSEEIFGTKVTMSVEHPKVEQVNEFSLGQIWLVSGSYNKSDMNTIEAGWQVFPGLYSDYQPRLFIFWTNDAYTLERCYNLRCPGFIQTSGSVLVEGAITRMFPRTELTIQIWRDPNLGHWWLSVGMNDGTSLAPVGYWPTEIFTRLTDFADRVQWGGEIINRNMFGRHTNTQMGSGYLPNSVQTAYMRDLEVAVNRNGFQPVYNLVVGATHPDYYRIKKLSDTKFSYGGPEHAGSMYLRLDSILIYFSFIIFFLF